MFRERAGTAALSGRDLATDQTLAALANVTARAAQYKDSGAFPLAQMDQLRAAAYLDLLNGIPAHQRIAHGLLTEPDPRRPRPQRGRRQERRRAPSRRDDCPCRECDGSCAPDDDSDPDDDDPDDDPAMTAIPTTAPAQQRHGRIAAARRRRSRRRPRRRSRTAGGPDGDPATTAPMAATRATAARRRRSGRRQRPDSAATAHGPGSDPGREAEPGGDSPEPGPVPPPPRDPAGPRPVLQDLIIPLATLLGLADRPGEGHGLGPLDPDLCRTLAATAAASPHTTICLTITNNDGIAIGHGCAKPAGATRPPTGPPTAGRPRPWSRSPPASTSPSPPRLAQLMPADT